MTISLNCALNLSLSPDTACVCRVLLLYMNSSGLGLEMSGGAPKPPTFLNPRRSGYLPQIIWATIPAICEAAGKQMLFFHLWNQVVGLQSALRAASGKRRILKWQRCLCASSRLVSERRGLPVTPDSTMKHNYAWARLAICSELLSARSAAHLVHFMMDNSVLRHLWQICLYSKLTFSTTMVNNMADLRHSYEQLWNCLTSAGRVRKSWELIHDHFCSNICSQRRV